MSPLALPIPRHPSRPQALLIRSPSSGGGCVDNGDQSWGLHMRQILLLNSVLWTPRHLGSSALSFATLESAEGVHLSLFGPESGELCHGPLPAFSLTHSCSCLAMKRHCSGRFLPFG